MNDPSTPLRDAAVVMHEMLLAYVDAGFTREEAMRLILQHVQKAAPPEAKS